jgi:hypothetical protein
MTVVDLEIYSTKSGNTLSDPLGSLTNLVCDLPGYYSFDLPAEIPINSGDDFYIKAKYYTPGYNYPLPIERFSDLYADPLIETGVCWASSSGTSWTAYGSDVSGKERDLCIKAYTVPNTTGLTQSFINNSFDFKYSQATENTINYSVSSNNPILEITIIDESGRTINKETFKNATINVSKTKTLKHGMYFISITTTQERKVEKVIVK